MRIATTQYQLTAENWNDYVTKMELLIADAKGNGADLYVLPEYAGFEIGKQPYIDRDKHLFASIQPFIERYVDFFKSLAIKYQLYILAGTIPVEIEEKKYVNRAHFFGPTGGYGVQDKLNLTEYEKNSHIMLAGNMQTIFETEYGKIGIAICYDSEFPEVSRRFVREGVWLILVPSYTVSMAGYCRVSLSSRARAIENQCCLVTSCLIGKVGSDHTVGNAGIYGPADIGFPDNGIIVEGKLNLFRDLFPAACGVKYLHEQVYT